MGQQMTAVVADGDRRRLFLSPNEEHAQIALDAEPLWRPIGKLPEKALGFRVQAYGYTDWHQLFTERQLAALSALSDALVEVRNSPLVQNAEPKYDSALSTYLSLTIGRTASGNCAFTRWRNAMHSVEGPFGRQALAMVWDFAEPNVFSESTQNWLNQIEWVAKAVERVPSGVNQGITHQADASTTIHVDTGPVIVTDPPYYDNIGYADLSDFFYVWLRPSLRDIYPKLFAGILSPKAEEMTAIPSRFSNSRQRFEDLLGRTLRLIRERCSPEFPSSIFYAYKQQDEQRGGLTSTGWETMLNAGGKCRV